jgi:hypothetical protein
MKEEVLVIHPDDRSTDFLTPIYENIPNKKVLRGGYTYDEVQQMIEEHDRIIMLGHGSPYGLFSMGKFMTFGGYIINSNMVSVLENKPECVFIWCNADMFMNQHPTLKGFYSGMFISEVGEANYMGLYGMDQETVNQSNNGFSEILGKFSNESTSEIYNKVREEYGVIASENPVAMYNHRRLYLRLPEPQEETNNG